ncbi:major facilitator superfamily MFS_1 [Formosa agariphila KMM 3901]|uniref:Major facilitator superfamily MFS_1 n=1 Tax=Formosa agariphila (strain DSM 15362 / KCTC 12365 / LMG 23005 / KMM 3901 / M-2Alg 35-1) TaxID=1347342 RepID=T2KKG1_FORAG|nr:MFS transporter [Formosa agariphila]CDF78933.1 major facilitator superfamily MFS_1 [Formosa agariphila KMM 3901]
MNKALLSLAIGGFGIGLTEFVIMGILPEIAIAFDISIPKAGHFISAYALGVVVGAPILTSIASKWPAHKVLMALMVWFTVFNTLSAFATGYNSFIILRFLSGLPHGAFFGIGAVVAGKLSKEGKSAQGIAIMFSGLTFANLLGVPLGTYLGKHFSWNLSFLLVGFVGVLVVLSIKLWMPVLKQSSETHFLEDLKIFKRLELWLIIILTTIGTGGFFAWYSYISPLITDVAGHSAEMVSVAMILAGLGMVIGNFIGAKLAEKFSPIYAIIITLVCMVICLSLNTILASDKVMVLVMTFIIGAVTFCLSTPIQVAIINASKGSETLGSSLNQSAFNIGNASGAYFAGIPIAMGYGFTSADWVGAAMAASGVLIAFCIILLRKHRSKNQIVTS